jgi:hypothetical protein
MMTELSSLIASVKAAYDIAKGVNSLKSEVDRNQSISKILEILLTVQTNALSVNAIAQKLQEEKSDLTKRIMEFENWAQTKSNYDLKEVGPGIPAYVRKQGDDSKEPPMWVCPYCYNKKKESFLQREYHFGEAGYYFCPECDTIFTWGKIGRGFAPQDRSAKK